MIAGTAAVLQGAGVASLAPDTWAIIGVIVAVAGILVTLAITSRRDSREAHANITKRIDGVDERISGRIDGVSGRIDEVKNELAKTNVAMAEFRGVTEARIQHLQETTDALKVGMDGLSAKTDDLSARTAKLTGAIEVITRIATRDQ